MARVVLATTLAVVFLAALSHAASAHTGETNVPAYTDVQEAIAILAAQPEFMDNAVDKVHDALDSADMHGVDLGLLRLASAALAKSDMDQALVLLEQSIGACPGAPVLNPQSPPRTPRRLPAPCPAPAAHLAALSRSHVGGIQEPVFLALGGVFVLAGLALTRKLR